MIMASLMVAPALRDIVYDPDADSVMLLDWENARRWPEFTPAGWGFTDFLFIASSAKEILPKYLPICSYEWL